MVKTVVLYLIGCLMCFVQMMMNVHVIGTSVAFVRSVKISVAPICAAVQTVSTTMAILAKVNTYKLSVIYRYSSPGASSPC